jgi:hypothetical protein
LSEIKYTECDSCINKNYDPTVCEGCDNGNGYEGEDDVEELEVAEFIDLFGPGV